MTMSKGEMNMPATKGSLRVISPTEGEKIATTDIPAQVAVSNFDVSAAHAGMPDVDGQGHVHVMLDGMTMGVLFNFYTTPSFTLPGRAMAPGQHTLIFDLASNTHEDFANTVQKVNIDYEPVQVEAAPPPAAAVRAPEVKILSPADGATLGPEFTVKVQPINFTPSLDLEGKPNIPGYGHYHVFVDMSMPSMEMSGQPMSGGSAQMSGGSTSGESMQMSGGGMSMMSMAGMVSMPGSNSFPVNLSAWKNGKHTLTIQPVQNDHTEIHGAKPAMITINLQGAAGS
jgi:hypothetical protein